MTLEEELASETDIKVIQRLKARAFAKLESFAGQSWSKGNLTATITSGPTLVTSERAISFTMQVTRDGEDITPRAMNPIIIANPPIMVPDGDGEFRRSDLRSALLTVLRDFVRQSLEI